LSRLRLDGLVRRSYGFRSYDLTTNALSRDGPAPEARLPTPLLL